MAVAVARLMLLLLLAAAAACLAAAETVSAPFTGEEREDYMLRLREKGGGSVLSLSDKTYPALAASGPRPYHLAVLLVAMADQYKCTMCAKALEEFKLAAENYRVHYEDQGKRSKDGGEEEPRVFFVVLDFPRSTETFRSLKVNQAPTAFHIPPKLSFAVDDYDVQPQAMMGIMKKSGWTAEDFALFVNMKAGTDFEIVRSQLVAMISLSLLVITVLASIKPLVRRRDQVMQVVRYKWLWFVISLSIYTFSISGGVYDMIRGPALFQEDPRVRAPSLLLLSDLGANVS
jgi:hypothetical protein